MTFPHAGWITVAALHVCICLCADPSLLVGGAAVGHLLPQQAKDLAL